MYAIRSYYASFLLTEEGWVEPRKAGAVDLYFFGYGHSYLECLRDFYRLTGSTSYNFV